MSARPKASREARGYGSAHRQRRRYLEPVVAAGNAVCTRCGKRIEPGSAWHLDHREDRRGYLGAAHATCNLRAAAAKTNAAKANERGEPHEHERRWSRLWHDPPPPGTVVYHGDGTFTRY